MGSENKLAKRVGDLSSVYAFLLNKARECPETKWIAEARDLAWHQLVEAHEAYLGRPGSGRML